MSEILIPSAVDNLFAQLPQTMSEGWNGDDWFTDLSNYAAYISTLNEGAAPEEATLTHLGATHHTPQMPGREHDNYSPAYPATQFPMPAETSQMHPSPYNSAQQPLQPVPNFSRSSVQYHALTASQMPMERLQQPATTATIPFPPIIPSQKLQQKSASSSASAHIAQPHAKRGRSESDSQDLGSSPRRRTSAFTASMPAHISTDTSKASIELSEEERLLIQLKQDQNLPWKEIAKEFEQRFGKPFQVPALQMRYKRLRERLRRWTTEDIDALEAAHNYWETNKFEIIASKMLDFGVQDRWSSKFCEKKWEQLHPEASRPETGIESDDRRRSQQSIPARFDTDLENHSVEWSMPSPRRPITSISQANSPMSSLAPTQTTTLPRNPFLQDESTDQ